MRPWFLLLGALGLGACSGNDSTPTHDAGATTDGSAVTRVDQLPIATTLRLPGLSGPVDVTTDAMGWKHIRATTLRDAAVVQGYLQATERMAQMDLLRRLASGTLGERFGVVNPAAIDQDLAMRVVGLRRAATAMWQQMQSTPSRERTLLEGFSAGVNLWLAALRRNEVAPPPSTDLVLDATTPDWVPIDSLTIGRYQSYSLSYTASDDIARSRTIDLAGTVFDGADAMTHADLAARRGVGWDLVVWRSPSNATVIGDFFASTQPLLASPQRNALRPKIPLSVYSSAKNFLDATERVLSVWGDTSRGSNNWVLDPSLTVNGHALVSNDPHLQLTSPAIWWGSHITVTQGTDAVDVAGTTFPGIPGVIIGFTPRLAWGVTTAYYDVTDVYLETVTPGQNGAPDTVRFNNTDVPIQVIEETVSTGSGQGYTARIEVVPHHGPILPTIQNGRFVPRTGNTALSIRWTGHQPTTEIAAFVAMAYAQNAAEARTAISHFGVGAQNWVFADIQGNAGYQSSAVIPRRAPGALAWSPNNLRGANPCMVLPGDGTAEWNGTVPPERIPHATLSPQHPFIATANNDQAGVTLDNNPFDAPEYLSCDYAWGWREERIQQRIQQLGQRATREQMEAIQSDATVIAAGRFRPFIASAFARLEAEWATPGTHSDLSALALALVPHRDRLRDASRRIATWSLSGESGVGDSVTDAQRSDSVATTLFHGWLVAFIQQTFSDEQTAVRTATMRTLSFDSITVLLNLLEHPTDLHAQDPTTHDSPLWDDLSTTTERETRDAVILRSLDTAMTELARVTHTEDVSLWLWGPLHTVRFNSLIPTTGAELSIPPDGDSTFPNGFPRHGGLAVIDASQPSLASYNFSYGSGPSQRFTVELDPSGPIAYNALPGGQSMDNTSPHFRDGAELWRVNHSHRVFITEPDIASHSTRRDRFEPMP